jgi:1,4-alpha-glucan branching enzyme
MKKKSAGKETESLKKRVTFTFAEPFAKEVTVAGTFNNWDSEKDHLKQSDSGHWKIVKYLPAGPYEYRFVVDGIWTNDPQCLNCRPNLYGVENCVLEVF